MKNKEKYAKEIIEEVIESGLLAIDKRVNKVKACYYVDCKNCLFYRANKETDTCIGALSKWANAEYKEPKIFTEREKLFVKLFPSIQYIARDKNGTLYVFMSKPEKTSRAWLSDNEFLWEIESYMNLDFDSIQWEDEEPTHRSEILGGER